MIKRCLQCGIEFCVGFKDRKRKYCSRSCYFAWRKQRATERRIEIEKDRVHKICPICHKTFLPNRNGQIYCSSNCGTRNLEHPSGREHYLYKSKTTLNCENCGKEFEVHNYRKDNARFCSHDCYAEWMAGNLIGEKAMHWLGGHTPAPYPIEFNEEFKESIRDRDGYKCAVCWQFGKDVHHVDYIKENTTQQNCITLCRNCHAKTNGDREYWQQKLGQLVNIRNGQEQETCIHNLSGGL